MSLNPAWRPTDLTESQLFEERTWLQGGILSAVAYGMVFTLFVLNFSLLKDRVAGSTSKQRKRMNAALLGYVCVMFVLSTLTMASQAQMTQLGFVDNRNFPGGPGAFQKEMFSLPISNMGNFSFSLMNWLADIVLLWRCTVIYRTCRYSLKFVMLIPVLMYITSFVTGVIYLHEISRPGASPWATEMSTLTYSIISLSLNVVLTLMIVCRLILHRRRIVKAIGPRHGMQYTSIIAILVESAFILDVVVLLFIIPFALGSPLANTSLSTLVQVQTIASYMIIFRVATGTAWASSTANTLMTEGSIDRRELSAMNFQRRVLERSTTAIDTRESHEVTRNSEAGAKSFREAV